MPRKSAARRRRFALLGNMGYGGTLAHSTRQRAQEYPQTVFFGIDLVPWAKSPRPERRSRQRPAEPAEPNPRNWRQFQGSFVEGLRRVRNNSVDRIESVLSVGHHGPRPTLWEESPLSEIIPHTIETLQVAHEKLRPGGVLALVVGDTGKRAIMESVLQTGFQNSQIRETRFVPSEWSSTWWARNFINKGLSLKIIYLRKKLSRTRP